MTTLLTLLFFSLAMALLIWVAVQLAGLALSLQAIAGLAIMATFACYGALKRLMGRGAFPPETGTGPTGPRDLDDALQMLDDGRLSDLTRQVIDDANRNPPPPRAPFMRRPPIALTRAARVDATADAQARSWFGGTPALGGMAWPKNGDGVPLHLMAQIDLAELQQQAPTDALPDSGALMFFCDVGWPMTGKVVYAAHPDYDRLLDTPQNAVPPFANEDWRHYFPGTKEANRPLGFPRWPIAFTPVPLDGDYDPYEEAATAAFDTAIGPRPNFKFDAAFVHKHLSENGAPVLLWKAGQMLANELSHATTRVGAVRQRVQETHDLFQQRVDQDTQGQITPEHAQKTLGGYQARLRNIEQLEPQFQTFAAEVYAYADSRDPFERMSPKGLIWLDKVLEAIQPYGTERGLFADLIDEYHFNFKTREYLMRGWLRAVANGPQDGFAALPASAQAVIAEQYNKPEGAAHQMFGVGVDIQGAGEMNLDHHLLLQLGYDTLMHWELGDMGALQFWISEDDLRHRRWDNAFSTLEAS